MIVCYKPDSFISLAHMKCWLLKMLRRRMFERVEGLASYLFFSYRAGYRGRIFPFDQVWVYHHHGRMAGVATITRLPSYGNLPLINVYVKPQFQRKGIGTTLLLRALKEWPNAVGVSTVTSDRLYRRFGVDMIDCNEIDSPMAIVRSRGKLRPLYEVT